MNIHQFDKSMVSELNEIVIILYICMEGKKQESGTIQIITAKHRSVFYAEAFKEPQKRKIDVQLRIIESYWCSF